MTDLSQNLSAYIDGELTPEQEAKIEATLAQNPAAQAELDALIQVDSVTQELFDQELATPVPFDLVRMIKHAELDPPVRAAAPEQKHVGWRALAASLAFLAIGALGGYVVKDTLRPPVQTAGWLADIADYHAVYAGQQRHLVEVGADETDHIEAWLGKTIGVQFSIPDLAEMDLTFAGGRLVVAAGQPVAQLMYRMADGTVIALCLQQSNKAASPLPSFKERTINGFDFVSWNANGADYVVIGPQGQPSLNAIAKTAATEV